ncbi:MAG: hypothetical protein WC680_02375 [Sulfuricurvum sp.]
MLSFSDTMRISRLVCAKSIRIRRIFCRSLPLVYADNTITASPSSEAILVLPPSDYWVLRVTLNVKTEKEAAKYGSALFELSDEYRYVAQKVGDNSYLLIAYNPDEISQKLRSLEAFSKNEKITFAQWVFADITQPIQLNNDKYLTIMDGIVIEMDSPYVQADTSVPLIEALASRGSFVRTVQIEGLASAEVTAKTLKTTVVIFVMLFANLVAEAIVQHQESNRLYAKIQEVLSESKLPETSIERVAILDSLKMKEQQQLQFRRQCKQISDIPMEVKPVSLPPLPAAPEVSAALTNGIVLIPGSKPGESNRLLIDNKPPLLSIDYHGEGMQVLEYDGHSINLIIDAHDFSSAEKLKIAFMKRFNKAQFEVHGNQLEVGLK